MLKLTEKIKPLVLCILDGWGIAEDGPGNAITQANPSNFNGLWFSFPHTYLTTMGQSVGLPEGVVGNSEVGHQNMGAGKIILQDLLKINNSIENGSFFENEAFLEAIDHAFQKNANIHLLGLVGPGNVHSDTRHLLALLTLLKNTQVPQDKVKIHVITDGRDSPPTAAKNYLSLVNEKVIKEKFGTIASICGRYYAMDRDNHWERTEKAYLALTGVGQVKSADPVKCLEESYASGVTDEFVKPSMIVDTNGNPLGPIKPSDSVIFFNFRPDRARQLTKAFVLDNFESVKTSSGNTVPTFQRGPKIQDLVFTTMTEYEKKLPVSAVAFMPKPVIMPLAKVFAERNMRQLHIAETEKYAHVTYFFNGGYEQAFPGEDRILIDSKRVETYDQAPEMSTPEVTKKVVERINTRVYDFIIVNFANADMVGHTGNIPAAIEAVKCVDSYLSIVVKAALSAGGGAIVTADHGNAEVMINNQTGQIDTEHNGSPAPCIFAFPEFRGKNLQLPKGILADIAPSILSALNISKPAQMSGRNLLE